MFGKLGKSIIFIVENVLEANYNFICCRSAMQVVHGRASHLTMSFYSPGNKQCYILLGLFSVIICMVVEVQ